MGGIVGEGGGGVVWVRMGVWDFIGWNGVLASWLMGVGRQRWMGFELVELVNERR